MKKAAVIFIVLFVLSLAVPAAACINTGQENDTSELATLFNSEAQA